LQGREANGFGRLQFNSFIMNGLLAMVRMQCDRVQKTRQDLNILENQGTVPGFI
jgi:hypothetical protein